MNSDIYNLPDDIKILLEKYYSGRTTISEERKLKNFFITNNLSEGDLLKFSVPKSITNFDDELIWAKVKETEQKNRFIKHRLIQITSIAASLVLVLAVSFLIVKKNIKTEQTYFTETYTDPTVAYETARKYLSMISSKLTYAYIEVKPMEKVILPYEAINSMSNLEKSFSNLERFNVISDYSDNLYYFSFFNKYINIDN